MTKNKERSKIRIDTDDPGAVSSPDYYNPIGATQDNHSNEVYLSELARVAGNEKFSYLDLGCAGGQSVVDVYEMGNLACGVEGSDLEKMLASQRWGATHLKGTEKKSGAENWKKYKDVCLFKADLTKDFELLNEDNEVQQFDIITAWDVMEHPQPQDIPKVLENIVNHLSDDGFFICLINLHHGTHHQCVKPKEWWLEQFDEAGLVDVGFDMGASPRHTYSPLDTNDIGFKLRKK